MTEERSMAIANALMADKDTAQRIMNMSAAEAAAEFGKMGYDFTVDELNAFNGEMTEAIKHVNADGELDEEALSSVSGGCARCVGVFALGFVAGAAMFAPW